MRFLQGTSGYKSCEPSHWRSIPGSARVSRAGEGVPPSRTFLQRLFRRDAETSIETRALPGNYVGYLLQTSRTLCFAAKSATISQWKIMMLRSSAEAPPAALRRPCLVKQDGA